MTEAEWLAAADPGPMLEHLHVRRATKPVPPHLDRYRLRWFAAACCRRVWPLLGPGDRAAVEAIEEYARTRRQALLAQAGRLRDGDRRLDRAWADDMFRMGDKAERDAARAVRDACEATPMRSSLAYRGVADAAAAVELAGGSVRGSPAPTLWPHSPAERAVLADLLRDVFGNPFRPMAFDPSWRTEAVVGVARGMDEARDFGPMPVLADALEDAGCEEAAVLAHCRGPGPHVRGCWVVDVVLGLM